MGGTERFPNSISIQDISTEKAAKVDPIRNLSISEPTRLVGTSFGGTSKDPNFWTETVTGSGAATQAGDLSLTTGTTADSSAQYQTVRIGRYVAGTSHYFRGVVRIPDSGVSNNTRRWGAFTTSGTTPQNGAWFQISGTTVSVATASGGSITLVASSSWNGGRSYSLDSIVHTYEIVYTNSKVYFFIDDTLMHTVSADTAVWTQNPSLPVTLSNVNSGGATTNVDFRVRVASVYRSGHLHANPTYKYVNAQNATVCKFGGGHLQRIIFNDPVSSTITLYDNTAASGTIIAQIDMAASDQPFNLDFDCPFNTGLTINCSAAAKITLIYE